MFSRFLWLTGIALTAYSGSINSTAASESPADPKAAMILSTGDNLFYYKWYPIDSPAGIRASFDLFKSGYNVDRIIWRGAQAQWMTKSAIFPPYPEEMFDLYDQEMKWETQDRLSHTGAAEARKRDLSYWGYMPFFEVGQGAEATCMAGFGPYNFNEKFRAEHPEYCLYDRAGVGIGSTIEFGYPEVRKEWLRRYEEYFKEGGDFSIYEGIIFYTYVENFYPRYTDQYMFSDIAVSDFKKRYGVDVLTQPFDIQKYQEMRGEYITQYLREMRQLFNKYGKKLAFYIDAKEPDIAMRWPCYPGILVPGSVKMDWRQWIKEGLIDEIALRTATDIDDIQPFLDATKGTNVRISLLTNQMPPKLKYLEALGVTRHIWSPELPTDFPKENAPLSALDGNDRVAAMSVLRQVRDGELDVPVEKLTALFKHPDLIVRRQAVAAAVGREMKGAIPALEEAAMDPENSFRCVAIDALGTLHGPNTVALIGSVIAKYPTMSMRIVGRTALSTMFAERSEDIFKLYRETNSPFVKLTILEMPIAKRAVPAVDAVPGFRPLVFDGATSEIEKLRFTAAFTAAYYPDRECTELALKLLDDKSGVVQVAAAFSLGEMARRIEDHALREQIFTRLVEKQKEFGDGSTRSDLAWGFRPVCEAILYGFGPRGERHLTATLNGSDRRLAIQAWNVLFHPNDGWNFYEIDREQGESLYTYYPEPLRTNVERRAYSLPIQAEILRQNFAGITPDPTGVSGTIWSQTGKWTGLDESVRFGDESGSPFIQIGVNKLGQGSRVVCSKGVDMPDRRFKNRLAGHFPASPVAYGLCDGVAELSLSLGRSSGSDSLLVGLAPDGKSNDLVGFRVERDGKINLVNGENSSIGSALTLNGGASMRFTLRLDFNTARATLQSEQGGVSADFAFDVNRQYRAIVFVARGDAESSTRVGDVRVTQRFE